MKLPLCGILCVILSLLQLHLAAQTDILHLKSDITDTIFGKVIPDPYRWMEDLNSDSIKKWLKAEEGITGEEKKKFKGRLVTALDEINRHSFVKLPWAKKTGKWYFYLAYSADASNTSPVLYYKEYLDAAKSIAFDPNDIPGKKTYSIGGWAVSDSGRYLAVALSPAGSDWREIRVQDLNKQRSLKDKIDWVKFSNIVWWQDGFFYARYEKPAAGIGQNIALSGQELYYHHLGEDQENDQLVMVIPGSENGTIEFDKTSNGRYLVMSYGMKISGKWYNVVTCKDLDDGIYGDNKLIVQSPDRDKAWYRVVDFVDSGFMVLTNYGAPHNRLLHCALGAVNRFEEIIPEDKKILKSVSYVHHELVATYFTAGNYEVHMFDYQGRPLSGIKFEAGISVSGFDGEPDDTEAIYYEYMFYMPTVVSRYNFITRKSSPVDKTQINYRVEDYTTEVVNYQSKDGTTVPMYLSYKKGIKLKGNNPVILEGYGGYGISERPAYKYANILFFDNGGILAVPMIRGGGELGGDWHEAGKGLKKQNSFDDFIDAADFLVREGYTSREKLAIMGGSNGGLLVGAVMTQRPDLCKVVVSIAGTLDMLRFNKFTGGRYWLNEYGSPDNPVDFNNLLSYSPLHNVHPGVSYPSTLFIAGRNDDRVPPFHTYKFLATIQESGTGGNPHVLYFQEEAGHTGAVDLWDRNSADAFVLAFIFTEMHLPLK